MGKKKGKKGKKKGGNKQKDGPVLDVPDYVNNNEELDDYFLEDATAQKKKKKGKFTGFESNIESRSKKREVHTLSEEEEEVTSTRKSKAQLKREKKARQKKKAEEEARKKAEEEARKKEEEQWSDDYSDEPLPKKKKKKKYYSDSESYSDEPKKKKYDDYSDDYSDYSDDPLPKKKKKVKKKYSDDDYSDYSDDPLPKKTKAKKKKSSDDDYSDYSDDFPKKKKSSKKKKYSDDDWSDYSDDPPKKKSKKKSKYSDDDYSDYSDDEYRSKKKKTTKNKKSRKYSDDYSDYSSDEPVSKKKSKGKARKYSDSFSDYSDEEPVSKKKKSTKKSKYSDDDYSDEPPKKTVNKKDPTKSAGPSQRVLNKRKKATKKKNKWAAFEELDDMDDEPEPVTKAPTMSDDSDSEEFVKSKPKKKPEPKKKANLWDLLDDSEEEESEDDDGGFNFGETGKKEATPPPVEVKATPNWKNKKKEKKKEKEEDEFADFFEEKPKQLTKAQKKRQRQKERKEAEQRAAELDKASGQDVSQEKEKTEEPAQAVDPDKPPEGLSKAALKRWKKKHKQKQAQNQPKQLTEAQKKRMAKFEEQERKRKEAEEEKLRKEEEERKRKEEEDRIAAERQAEAEKRRAEKNKRLRDQKKKNKGRGNASKLRGANVDLEERRRLAAERKAQRDAQKKNKKSQNNKRKVQEEERRKQEEAEKARLAEIQRQKEEAEAKKKAEAEAQAEKERLEKIEREERNRRITEMAAQALAKKKGFNDDSDDDWEDADVERRREVATKNNQWGETESNPWDDDESSDQEPPKKTWDDDESEDEEPPAKKVNNWDDDESDDEPEPPKKKANNWDDDESDDEPEPSQNGGNAPEKTQDDQDADKAPEWSDSEEDVQPNKVPEKKKKGKKKRKGKKGKKAKEIDLSKLRAPIGVIMGNVNAGKTALLDYIRGTKVQEGEAGGITQQIGATNLPIDDIIEKAGEEVVKNMLDEVHLPGLLVIDTPGHAAFDNLRERGSAMCDIAIVVVNIFNGMEGTTAECVNMLKENKAPFIIALNQIDRLSEWKSCPGVPINKAIEQQEQHTQSQFHDLFMKARADFASHCHLNADLFWESKDLQKNRMRSDNVNVVPTSAFSGDGVSDLLLLWVKMSQIPKIAKKLVVKPKLRCTVLEVNKIQGYGHTLDVIISDGYLKCGQTVVCCGMNGPVITKIRALLTPKATQDLRVKILEYTRHTEIYASAGVRVVTVEDVSAVVPGSKIMKVNPCDQDEIEEVVDEVMAGLEELKSIQKEEKGVYVVASTLGSLQALVKFVCDKVNVPICGTSIGRVYKKDVMKAMVMLEKKPEWAIILAFDVDVDQAAAELAEYEGIRIFTAPIIYHLQTMFEQYIEEVKENARAEIKEKVVFPVLMNVLDDAPINRKNPIILGMHVKKGTLRMNTPLCAFTPDQKVIFLGRVTGIQYDGADKETAKKDEKVAVKIDLTSENDTIIEFGRHFTKDARIISRSTRDSFDILKTFYRTETTQEDLGLLKNFRKIFNW